MDRNVCEAGEVQGEQGGQGAAKRALEGTVRELAGPGEVEGRPGWVGEAGEDAVCQDLPPPAGRQQAGQLDTG